MRWIENSEINDNPPLFGRFKAAFFVSELRAKAFMAFMLIKLNFDVQMFDCSNQTSDKTTLS